MVFQQLVVANRRQMLPSLCGLPAVGPNRKSLKRPRDDCLLTLLEQKLSPIDILAGIHKWSYNVSTEKRSVIFERLFNLDITTFDKDCPFLTSFQITFTRAISRYNVHNVQVTLFYNNQDSKIFQSWPLYSNLSSPFANSAPFQGVVYEIKKHKSEMISCFEEKNVELDRNEFINPLSIFETAESFHRLLVAAKAALENEPEPAKKPYPELQCILDQLPKQ